MMFIAEWEMMTLRQKRQCLQISLVEIQKRTGINPTCLSRIENGIQKITPEMSKRIGIITNFLNDCYNGKINYQISEQANVCKDNRVVLKEKYGVSSKEVFEIREIRESLNLSQQDVADAIGVSDTAIYDKEIQRRPLWRSEYKEIMEYFRQEKLKRIFGDKNGQ